MASFDRLTESRWAYPVLAAIVFFLALPGLLSMPISPDTGLAARPGDPDAIFETFMAGHLPPQAEVDTALPAGQSDEENKESDDSLF